MNPTRLHLLVDLERLGTMTAVAEATGMGTSAVSKHLAVLEREAGTALLTPDGRRVRLTPAGRRLAGHAREILAHLEAARAELSPDAEPAGMVTLASFAGAVSAVILPALGLLGARHPGVAVGVIEHEPDETLRLLQSGEADLGVVYDYSLVPRGFPDGIDSRLLGTEPMLLIRAADEDRGPVRPAAAEVRDLAEASWIANSRGCADDELAHRLCAICGFAPRIRHRIDELWLLTDLVAAGLGVGFLPQLGSRPRHPGVAYIALGGLGGSRRFHLVARSGAWSWPPIRALADTVAEAAGRCLDLPK
jgi:DNA-binding transcriptional LysR family regulator